jgi:hypothetical protein
MPLEKRTVHIPLTKGVDNKTGEINLELPQLAAAHEVYFPKLGSISKRKGWAALDGSLGRDTRVGTSTTLDTLGGGKGLGVFDNKLFATTAPEDSAGIAANGNLFNWADELGRWNPTPAHKSFEPIEVSSKTICDSPTEQYFGDRARYTHGDGTILDLVVWYEVASLQWAIIDPVTDSVIYRDTVTGTSGAPGHPRVIVCDTNWQIWYTDGTDLKVRTIAADTFVTSEGVTVSTGTATVLATSASNVPFAVKKKDTIQAVAAIRNAAGTGYQIVIVDKTGTANVGPVTPGGGLVAGVASPIDIAYSPETTRLVVFRVNATPALRADLLNSSTLADVTTDIAVDSGGGVQEYDEISGIFTGKDQGAGVRWCRVFFSGRWQVAAAVNSRATKCKIITSGGTVTGTVAGPSGATYWAIHENLASHAFSRNTDSVYIVTAHRCESDSVSSGVGGVSSAYVRFGSYHLWRHDGLMLCDFLAVTGSRLQVGGVEDLCHTLPQVDSLGNSRYAVAFADRKHVSKIGFGAYGNRTIKDFTFEFDVPLVSLQMGRVAYLPNGMTYDGQGAYEQGFTHNPHLPFATAISFGTTGGAAGSGLEDAETYGYALVWEWTNAQGELDISGVESVFTITTPAGGGTADDTTVIFSTIPTLVATMKRSSSLASLPPSLAVYRTIKAPPDGSPYYRVTSLDPTATGTNGYVFNDPTTDFLAFTDGMPDATLITKDTLYTSNGELAHFHSGVGKVLAQGQNRMFKAGGEDGNQILYSKNWEPGEVVSYSDALVIQIPEGGGAVTAVVPLDSQLVVFKEKQIYTLQGTGNDDTGSSGGYTNPQLVESSVGCIDARTVAQFPGGVLFQSHKGLMSFSGGGVQYIGGPVEDYVTTTMRCAVVAPDDHQVLWFLESPATALHAEPTTISVLMYDYLVNQWATWGAPENVKNAVIWNEAITFLQYVTSTTQVGKQSVTKLNLEGGGYNMKISTPWIKPADVQGFGRLWRVGVTGKYIADHKLRVQLAYDYNNTLVDSFTEDWSLDPGAGVPYQVRVSPSRQLITAVRIHIFDVVGSGTLADSAELSSLALEIGVRSGIMRTPTTRSL